jgi:hypothetical protein
MDAATPGSSQPRSNASQGTRPRPRSARHREAGAGASRRATLALDADTRHRLPGLAPRYPVLPSRFRSSGPRCVIRRSRREQSAAATDTAACPAATRRLGTGPTTLVPAHRHWRHRRRSDATRRPEPAAPFRATNSPATARKPSSITPAAAPAPGAKTEPHPLPPTLHQHQHPNDPTPTPARPQPTDPTHRPQPTH